MSDLASPSILYIEDNNLNRRLIQKILESRGYTVHLATDGLAGLDLVHHLRPALLLLDIDLPGIDGLEITARLRAHPELCTIPIIAITASTLSDERSFFIEAGCDDYLAKPVDPLELLGLIDHFLSNGRAYA